MITIRQSHLEAFRRVVDTECGKEEELIEQIRGVFVPNWKMEAGSAWHSCLEGRPLSSNHPPHAGRVRSGAYQFLASDVRAGQAVCGPGVWEVPWTRMSGTFCITGTIDHMRGADLQDNKTKFSPTDPKDYEPSLQWRVYLWLTEGRYLKYNCFEMKDPDDEGFIEMKTVHSFSFWPYEGMAQEIDEWVRRFVDWAESRNLIQYLQKGMS